MYQRLFICETSKEGQSYLVELDECQVAIKCVYHGLWKRSVGVMPFDTTKNWFLATSGAFKIKFWDMDYGYLLKTTAAQGGLLVMPMEALFLTCLQYFEAALIINQSLP